jgi:hypothetical protein
VRERITWDVYKFLDQPVVSNPAEGPLYVQEDGESAVPQIGMSDGVRVKLRNLNCSGGRRLLISRKFFRRVERIFSKTFPAMFMREMGRYEWGLVGYFPGLEIMTVVPCGEMVGAYAVVKDDCQGKNGSPREVFKYGGSKFVWLQGLSIFQQLERVVFREGAEEMIGGVASEVIDAS